MIDYTNLDDIAAALSAYRANGQERVLFDTRDRGNYSEWGWPETAAMLRKADPTGLAMGLLLGEMIEATITGSQVRLSRVLREPGFVEQLHEILQLKTRLDALVADPAAALLERLASSLQEVSSDFGAPSSREAAICLRDAIYSMDKGLTLRWLQFDADAPNHPVRLNADIRRYPDIASFTLSLRHELPFGAHLARIGQSHTAIGIRLAGRVAYLSSLALNIHRGTMDEHRASGHLMAESLDLDTAVERYPDWSPRIPHPVSGTPTLPAPDAHVVDHIAKLPRDRLIWLAMVIEMAAQRMAATRASEVELTEVLGLALPAPCASEALPVVVTPNWSATALPLAEMLKSLKLAPWESNFLQPALEGLTAATFLPEAPTLLRLDTKETHRATDQEGDGLDYVLDYKQKKDISENSVEMLAAPSSWLGTRAELEAARRTVFGINLSEWLLAWGNRRFNQEWAEYRNAMAAALKRNLPEALTARCATREAPDFSSGFFAVHNIDLYSQSPKHKGYNPRCVLNAKNPVTDIAHFVPQDSADIVEMLGLPDESALPAFLQGWSRVQSWTTSDPDAVWARRGDRPPKDEQPPPYRTSQRWCFSPSAWRYQHHRVLEAIVQVNRNNCPVEIEMLASHAR